MGICSNNNCIPKIIFCNTPAIDNNIIIINLDKNNEEKNKDNNDKSLENKNEINNISKQNDTIELYSNNILNKKNLVNNKNKIIIYKIQTRFKSKLKSSSNNIVSNQSSQINNNKTNETNNYREANEKKEKLIHFSNFSNNVSVTTNSIIK